MAVGRRAFLRTGAAAAAAAALGPAPLSAQGKGPIRLAYLQLGWAATEIIHKEDLLAKHGWNAEYSVVAGAPGTIEYSACQPRLPSRSSLWIISVAAQPSWR